jgi:oxygen-independent coproporphyrinogen-3 oxidase
MNYCTTDVPPYTDRVAQPIYFYPFLSPLSNKSNQDILQAQQEKLARPPESRRPTLIYVHIPYCRSLCFFCGFYRELAPSDLDVLTRYVQALQAEMRFYSNSAYVQGLDIQAIYFGGGTPTILPPHLIADLLTTLWESFSITEGTELSYEGEVRTMGDPERLNVLRQMGCTRISFGVQSFNPRVRQLSGLKPSETDILTCIDRVREAGYKVNLDLMYGLPGQTHEIWRQDLERAIALGATNIDIYDTVLYPHSQIFRMRKKLKNDLPDESSRLTMLSEGLDNLAAHGYLHETIEDFTQPGFAYRMKRLVYGGGDGRSQMIGIGASSIGYLADMAYRNLTPGEYETHPANDFPPVGLIMPIGLEDELKRALVFFPKLLKLSKSALQKELLMPYEPVLDRMAQRGLLEEQDDAFTLTPLGKLWTDNMGMEFLESREQQRIWKVGY